MGSVLEVNGVSVQFGGIAALSNVDFTVQKGSITGIIGPNGAGKSTLLNVVSRYINPNAGEVFFNGESIKQWASYELPRRRMARTFQKPQLYPQLTVLDNLIIAGYSVAHLGLLESVARPGRARDSEEQLRVRATEILESVGLQSLSQVPVSSLPHAQQRFIEVCRSLMLDPALVLLDEPAGGMSREELKDLAKLLRQFSAQGVTVVLVEHVMPLVMAVCDRLVVLNFGNRLAEGSPADIRCNPEVIKAYLGEEA